MASSSRGPLPGGMASTSRWPTPAEMTSTRRGPLPAEMTSTRRGPLPGGLRSPTRSRGTSSRSSPRLRSVPGTPNPSSPSPLPAWGTPTPPRPRQSVPTTPLALGGELRVITPNRATPVVLTATDAPQPIGVVYAPVPG